LTPRLTHCWSNFRLFNINPVQQQGTEKEFRNFGPNFSFKLRNELGEATEYENYMSPVEMNGRQYYLRGVRHSQNDPFQYLYIPAAPNGGIERFMQFQNWLHDAPRIKKLASTTAQQSVSLMEVESPGFVEEVTNSMASLLMMFVDKGSDGVVAHVDATVPEAERANVLEAYLKVLQMLLAGLYAELLTENGVDLSQGISEQDGWFFDDAVNAIGAIGSYGSPFFIQLTSFEHTQSTGLQIAKAPCKTMIYKGLALLIAGVFCMF